jgi:hypothetical protein
MNKKDRDEFKAYLRACTIAQVHGMREKEALAGRFDYETLAEAELERRNLPLQAEQPKGT